MRILAVDDDPVILEMLQNALTKHDHYDLLCCDSAEAAQKIMRSDPVPFDCFLLDVMLPGIDGIELCDKLRSTSAYRTTPIIMITASRAPDLMGRAFYAGATDFVSKPLDGVELGARINSASMLNESLRRERAVQHSLDELSKQSKVRFGEAIKLETKGVQDLLAMENELLRMPAGVYGMNLFCIDVLGLRGIHRAVHGPVFRKHLDAVAKAATDAMKNTNWMLAYTGNGRYVGITMGRSRLNKEDLIAQMNAKLEQTWDRTTEGAASIPELRIVSVTDQRILSGVSASDKIRDFLKANDLTEGLASEGEENLFGQYNGQNAAA